MKKIKISKDAPAGGDQAAHLLPVIDFLIEQRNKPLSLEFKRDKGGIGTFVFAGQIDSDQLKERFEFPDSIKVGEDAYYGGGTVWDERNALKIHRG